MAKEAQQNNVITSCINCYSYKGHLLSPIDYDCILVRIISPASYALAKVD